MVWSQGESTIVLEIFARIFKILAQVAISWLLLTIAFGWTVTFRYMEETDVYAVTAVFVTIVHLFITGLTFIDDDEYHKYHDFGGVQGFVLIVIKLILYGIFIYGIVETSKTANQKQKQFLRSLLYSGSAYLLSFPVLWVLSYLVQPYIINRMITFGTISIQALSAAWILNQLTARDTIYYQASHKSKGILPRYKGE